MAMASSDMVTYVAPSLPFGAYTGPDGLLRLQSDWSEGFDEVAVTTRDFVDAGEDQVVVRALHAGRGVQSGVPVEIDVWYVFTVRGRKAIRAGVFVDKAEALEAAGLAE